MQFQEQPKASSTRATRVLDKLGILIGDANPQTIRSFISSISGNFFNP
jgi:hypothetical protein